MSALRVDTEPGGDVTCLYSQHLGWEGRDRWISEFEAWLAFRASSSTSWVTERNPVTKKKKKKVNVVELVYYLAKGPTPGKAD